MKTRDVNINLTSYQGKIKTTYDVLVKVFGEPEYGPDEDYDKITCEWNIEFDDGTIATIYDWKTKSTPRGEYTWHIGGRSMASVDAVYQYYNLKTSPLVKFIEQGVDATS
jgi:hypothetical protein